jgi:adenylate cyclase
MALPGPDPTLTFSRHSRVIAVLDVVESVRLMEQDEHGFIRRWHDFVQHARALLPEHGGRMHKSLGDGLMLEFSDAQGCVKTGFALLDWCRQANQALAPAQRMYLRVGAHMADFVADQYDIYGSDVNLTARVAGLAGPGEFIVTAALRDRLADGMDGQIEDLGECHLKHVREPVRAYRLGPVGDAPVIAYGGAMQDALRPSIAVIPFRTLSSDPAQDMLGEALADDVIAALSRTSELHVISRLSTTVFRDRAQDLGEMRRHLGASYVLTGSCRTLGDRLTVFAELADPKTGHIVWADSFTDHRLALFSPDRELVSRIVGGITGAVVVSELNRARGQPLPTLDAYTLMLGAIALMHRNTITDFQRAQQCLEHLAERAPRHPLPSAWLAQWHVLKVQQGWADDSAREGRLALEHTRRALDNDPGCALAFAAEGFVHTNLMRDLETGLDRYDTALSLNPNDSLANLLKGTLHAFKGEGEAAVAGTERALTLSPLDPIRYFYDSLAASAAVAAGRYERAIELARRSLRANRTHTSTYRALAIAQALAGRADEARQTVQELLKLEPQYTVSSFVTRSPSSRYPIGKVYAQALRDAGLPP